MAKPNKQTNTARELDIELPDKKYFTIGEVAKICQLKAHVLRYWEQVFSQLEPSKRRGRRYYQRVDIELVLEIKSLLHNQGFTIPGAKARLSKGAVNIEANNLNSRQKSAVKLLLKMQEELQMFRQHINHNF